LARVRVRQHVNPLSHKYLVEIPLPNWQKIYGNLAQNIHLDIGCAKGKFLLQMASLYPEVNFLGIEIREPLVAEANSFRDELGLTNLHFFYCNINHSLINLLESLPKGCLKTITIQFPDPWFKTRHNKRRVVTPELVNILADYLPEESIVFLQSDVKLVAEEMRNRFAENPHFIQQHLELWLQENPFPIPTEREVSTLAKNQPVYRVLFRK
jgi:tRNA (guanine-N7-)-methyltransferase